MTTGSTRSKRREGLKVARLVMVLSSLAPLFILWGIRGNCLLPDRWFITICALMAVLPSTLLALRLYKARKNSDKRTLTIGIGDDHRGHLLVYLFAMLLPFYREEMATPRDLAAMLVALVFIVFLFWHLNLHYINILFALFGYRVFTVSPPQDGNPYTGKEPFILITCRRHLQPGEDIDVYRLSDTVYVEMDR